MKLPILISKFQPGITESVPGIKANKLNLIPLQIDTNFPQPSVIPIVEGNQRNSTSNTIPQGSENVNDNQSNCPNCRINKMLPLYAIGSVGIQFPSLGIQREYEFERSTLSQGGANEQHNLYEVLHRCRHIARSMCWTLKIQGIDAYHLIPRSEQELNDLIDTIKPVQDGRPADTDVIIGWKGPIREAAGLTLPTLFLENSYSFDVNMLISTMAESLKVNKAKVEDFTAAARELFDRIQQIADNMGEMPAHRALNYLVVRFAPAYEITSKMFAQDFLLTMIEAKQSRLSSEVRTIQDVILSFAPRKSGAVEQYFVRVDVTELFPHPLTGSVQPYFER